MFGSLYCPSGPYSSVKLALHFTRDPKKITQLFFCKVVPYSRSGFVIIGISRFYRQTQKLNLALTEARFGKYLDFKKGRNQRGYSVSIAELNNWLFLRRHKSAF